MRWVSKIGSQRGSLEEYKAKDIDVHFNHVPAHVNIHGNESADRVIAAATRRAHRNCVLPAAEREKRRLEALADSLVASLLVDTN